MTHSSPPSRSYTFTERAFIDHHCLRHVQDFIRENGTIDEAGILGHRDRMLSNLEHAARMGMTSYVIFTRAFELIHFYDELGDFVCPPGSAARARAEFLGQILDQVLWKGRELGLSMVFHTNQFWFPDEIYRVYGDELGGPTSRVCPGRPRVWELLAGKLDAFLMRFPAISALQLTTSETQVSVTRCRCSACQHLSAPDRFLQFVTVVHEVCRAHGVECQLRTWGEIDTPSVYAEFADQIPEGVVVSTKHTDGDFHLTHGPNPLIGIGAAPQLVEFDCWGEYFGWNHFPCYIGDVLAERMRLCAEHGVRRVHARINWNPGTDRIFDVPYGNFVNLQLFTELARDPYQNPDILLDRWVRKTFGRYRASDLAQFYRDTQRIQRVALTFLGAHCGSHSCLFYNLGCPNYRTRIERLIGSRATSMICRRPELLLQREAMLERLWSAARGALAHLRTAMPQDWHIALQRAMENERFVSLLNNECLKLYVCIAQPEQEPFDLDEVGAKVERLVAEWCAHDPLHATWREYTVAEDIVAEARACKEGRTPDPPGMRKSKLPRMPGAQWIVRKS